MPLLLVSVNPELSVSQSMLILCLGFLLLVFLALFGIIFREIAGEQTITAANMNTRGDWRPGERFRFESEEYTFINFDAKTGIYYAKKTLDETIKQFLSRWCWVKIG